MKLSLMRYIDETVGTFLTRLLRFGIILKRLVVPVPAEVDRLEVRTVICQKYFGLGSILHAVPLVKALRYHYPNASIIFMTLPSNREVVELCRIADEVRTIDTSSPLIFLRELTSTLLYLLRKRVDISIDLEFFSKFSLFVSVLCGARRRVGLYMKKIRPGGVLTDKVFFNNYRHISEIYFAYAETVGIARRPEFFDSLLPHMDAGVLERVMAKLSIPDNTRLIVVNVNVGTLSLSRRWPAEHFVRLIQRLVDSYPEYCYLLVGMESEFRYVENIAGRIGHNNNLINCAGMTTVPELFALIESAFLFISCDSGPLHIASLYRKNLVGFYGPETPIVYGPTNSNSLVFYSGKHYCSPCLSVYDSKKCLYGELCPDNDCLRSIDPDAVFQTIEDRFLSRSSGMVEL
ncbi:MAG: glycosyltransferase family 9 protein [Desulfuromonadaceae bacterium]|nr:glycosyltransferase family 9 protein [Desulfuromonadaceae bacterium]MDD2856446.1 glycosyltransferase family 9 protein [Desulfuromonadaceae bacterium]